VNYCSDELLLIFLEYFSMMRYDKAMVKKITNSTGGVPIETYTTALVLLLYGSALPFSDKRHGRA